LRDTLIKANFAAWNNEHHHNLGWHWNRGLKSAAEILAQLQMLKRDNGRAKPRWPWAALMTRKRQLPDSGKKTTAPCPTGVWESKNRGTPVRTLRTYAHFWPNALSAGQQEAPPTDEAGCLTRQR